MLSLIKKLINYAFASFSQCTREWQTKPLSVERLQHLQQQQLHKQQQQHHEPSMRVHIKLTRTTTTTTTTDYTVPKKEKYIESNIFRFISLSNLLSIIVPRPLPSHDPFTASPRIPEESILYLQIVSHNFSFLLFFSSYSYSSSSSSFSPLTHSPGQSSQIANYIYNLQYYESMI